MRHRWTHTALHIPDVDGLVLTCCRDEVAVPCDDDRVHTALAVELLGAGIVCNGVPLISNDVILHLHQNWHPKCRMQSTMAAAGSSCTDPPRLSPGLKGKKEL